jgi:hypothetical protein
MNQNLWIKSFAGAITICDMNGIILEMNNQAIESFQDEGGNKLIGTNVLNCHPEPARSKLAEMLKNHTSNIYTIEKNGLKKLIYQTPWHNKGTYAGIMEISLPIPSDIPHFIRK